MALQSKLRIANHSTIYVYLQNVTSLYNLYVSLMTERSVLESIYNFVRLNVF